MGTAARRSDANTGLGTWPARRARISPDRTALTEPGQLERWAPYSADRDLGRTGSAALTMLGADPEPPTPIVVTRADAPDVLVHTWGDDVLQWELTPRATGTRLTLRHTVQGAEWGPKVAAGWHLCVVVLERLKLAITDL